jgi:hypothetical protein
MPGSTANQGHGVALLALGQVLDEALASPKRGLGACGPGEVVGVAAGVDGVQHDQLGVVDRPLGVVERVGRVGLGPIRLAAASLASRWSARRSIFASKSSSLAAASAFISAHLLVALAAAAAASWRASLAFWSTSALAWSMRAGGAARGTRKRRPGRLPWPRRRAAGARQALQRSPRFLHLLGPASVELLAHPHGCSPLNRGVAKSVRMRGTVAEAKVGCHHPHRVIRPEVSMALPLGGQRCVVRVTAVHQP